jgi:hypothetical protein
MAATVSTMEHWTDGFCRLTLEKGEGEEGGGGGRGRSRRRRRC